MVKIHKGTPSGSTESLCATCRHAVITQGYSINEVMTTCASHDRMVTFRVVSCSSYDDATKPSIYEMRQIAWVVESNKKTNRVGFVSPAERAKRPDDFDF